MIILSIYVFKKFTANPWKYNRRAEVLIDHIEKVYDSNDCDLSFITGIFAAIRRTKKSRNPKVNNDRYV